MFCEIDFDFKICAASLCEMVLLCTLGRILLSLLSDLQLQAVTTSPPPMWCRAIFKKGHTHTIANCPHHLQPFLFS